jgi:hypothetical protein
LKKIKLEGEAISEILVVDTAFESGTEATVRKEKTRDNNNSSSSKPQHKLP